MKKTLILIGIIFAIILLWAFGTYKLMNARTFQLFGGLTSEVDTKQKVVAITFDDGPTKNVESILPLLENYHAKATFFLIGNELKKNPEEGKNIADAGHQIGNHSFSHHRMIFKSPAYIKNEIESTDRLIRETGYKGEIDFRPPNGKKLVGLPYYLKKQNRDTIMWSLEPDTYNQSASEKVKYVSEHVKPGSIILLHAMYDQKELKALEGILKELSNKGYHFVTVNQLQSFEK
ncbi:polysaccharide deacetylase family protein [Falsibacillus albus]|uniref:Polysaccharide deacetylase n=1 Tax=Falsibacillus albus TaxID=2478915 RepID=A0A3L7K5W5_9BACI|nr:polysaccharide deacetylase family protein [Falsibacillus albus]RLQ97491.1 polysaccharide deacetylase [Falsibacillus albus]